MAPAKIKQISLLQTFNMLTCAVNHHKIDLTYSIPHTPFSLEPPPLGSIFLKYCCSEQTLGNDVLISLSGQVFQWIVFIQMKAVDFSPAEVISLASPSLP